MKKAGDVNMVFARSEDLVARKVQGEFIIIPITSGIGGPGDEIFSFNATGKAVWDMFDGKKTLKAIAAALSRRFAADTRLIERDVTGLAQALHKKRMLVRVKTSSNG